VIRGPFWPLWIFGVLRSDVGLIPRFLELPLHVADVSESGEEPRPADVLGFILKDGTSVSPKASLVWASLELPPSGFDILRKKIEHRVVRDTCFDLLGLVRRVLCEVYYLEGSWEIMGIHRSRVEKVTVDRGIN
jgi:hypothetical protein